MTDDSNFDYLFEETGQDAMSLVECIGHVKQLYDTAAKGTKLKAMYYTMWSTLCSQRDVLQEMNRYMISNRYLHQRVKILERLVLLTIDKSADLSQDDIVQRILDGLKKSNPT